MEYFYILLIFAGFWFLTTMFSAYLGLLVPIIYFQLGFLLGVESWLIGVSGFLGSLVNIFNTSRYIREHGAMSNAPIYSRIASYAYIIAFITGITLKLLFNLELGEINYWYLLLISISAWIILNVVLIKKRKQSLVDLKRNVIRFEIVEKYNTDPKWATYLYFENGEEGWNQTVHGSFLAKDPVNDMTFVHHTKEDALNYANSFFVNAEYINNR